MESLPPIPTPPSQRWREFRIQILPVFTFLCALVGIVLMWSNFLAPVGIIGTVESQSVSVTSAEDGILAELNVDVYQQVARDQIIGRIENVNPDLIKAEMAAAVAELKILEKRIRDSAADDATGYQRLRVSILEQKISQASEKAELVAASNELLRISSLFVSNLVSQADYDQAKAKAESLQGAIEERAKLIADFEQKMQIMDPKTSPGATAEDPIAHAIETKVKESEALLQPKVIRAPIDGVVSSVLMRAGQNALRGATILNITAPNSQRIIGYIRQPIQSVPRTNDTVVVSTRTSSRRQFGKGKVIRVGAAMELINPALLDPAAKRMEVGLPILVSVPSGMELVPGEFVDISLQTAGR